MKIEPASVFKYFEEMSAIPRGSGNEKAISDYLVDCARKLGLWVHQDEYLNVIIRKPASAGYENSPAVILQGHMDMVCEKNRDKAHDFTKDPIKLIIDGDFLKADGTTLGADNGIAMAIGLALMADASLKHPPIELLITSSEETGMDGAQNLDPSLLKGRRLINIDSEEEGIFLTGCAGGMHVCLSVPTETVDIPNGYVSCVLQVGGLHGGHSGADIHKGLGNSNLILSRALCGLDSYDYYLVSIEGGAKANAIPREAEARLAIKEKDYNAARGTVAELDSVLKNENRDLDPGVSLTLKPADEVYEKAFTKESGRKVAVTGSLMPNGVQSMCKNALMKGIVETSLNLGVVSTNEGRVVFSTAIRSSVVSRGRDVADKLRLLAEVLGAGFEMDSEYPSWEFDPDSNLQKFILEQYKAFTGKDALLTAIHAGLECGLFAKVLNKPDMISMGPNIYGAHTPEERISISSTARVWEFLKYALANMK